jgi:hypothetical protein
MKMELTAEQVRALAQAVNLEIPAADFNNVMLRLSALFAEMDNIERELGAEMDKTEPIPPVYPHEEF